MKLENMIVQLRKCCKLEESLGAIGTCKTVTSSRVGVGVGLGNLNLEVNHDSV